MFRVIHKFKDLKDRNHIYNVGDEYPREGLKPTKKRLEELSGEKNKIGETLIVEETIEEVTTEEVEKAVAEEPVKDVAEEVAGATEEAPTSEEKAEETIEEEQNNE